MRILYLAPNPENPDRPSGRPHDLIRSYASPGTEIEFSAPEDYAGAQVLVKIQGEGALPGLHHVLSTTAFIRKVAWAEANGYSAVIQSNTFDPGVEAARFAAHIPVIGVCRTSLHAAAVLAGRIGIAVPFQSHVAETWRLVRHYGMEQFVKDIQPIGLYPGNMESKEQLRDRIIEVMEAIRDAVDPEYIIPLGGALVPYVVDPRDLEKAVGVPVMNTTRVTLRFAETCVAAAMTQSYVAYPHTRLELEDFERPAYS